MRRCDGLPVATSINIGCWDTPWKGIEGMPMDLLGEQEHREVWALCSYSPGEPSLVYTCGI